MEKLAKNLRNKFNHPELFDLAILVPKECQKAGYERLEFLGDRVVGLIVSEMLYKNFPHEAEGELAKRFVVLVCADTLAQIATEWGVDEIIKKENRQLRHNKNILADLCEAILGALYLDKGLKEVKEVMIPTWEPLMMSYKQAPQDYKSKLQEWTQKKFQVLPTYQLLEKTGAAHKPEFTISVEAGPYHQTAKGPSIKQAEQTAAEQVLMEIHATNI